MAIDTFRVMAVLLTLVAASGARPAASSRGPCSSPGDVLHVDANLAPTIVELWRTSPTFHRQVARLAATGVVVSIERCRTRTECPSSVRASTTMSFQDDVLARANVRILFPSVDAPELIAHELEHVIERLDGVDLARFGDRGPRVVRVDERGHYETARAQHMGRLAAAEYRAGSAIASACERTVAP